MPRARSSAPRIPPPSPPRWSSSSKGFTSPASSTRMSSPARRVTAASSPLPFPAEGGLPMTIGTRALLALGLIVVISASVAWAQTPAAPKAETPAGKPGVVVADVTRITATVEAIDQAKHTVTLKGWQGRTVILTVPPEAKNFDQIKVGDKVKV